MSVFTILPLFVALLFFWKASNALANGRIEVGWVFEPVIAHRNKDPFMFWFMLAGSILMGVCASAMALYGIISPTT